MLRIQPRPIGDRVKVAVSIVIGVLIVAGHFHDDVGLVPVRILALIPHPVDLESGVFVAVRRQKIHLGAVVGRRRGGVFLGHGCQLEQEMMEIRRCSMTHR